MNILFNYRFSNKNKGEGTIKIGLQNATDKITVLK